MTRAFLTHTIEQGSRMAWLDRLRVPSCSALVQSSSATFVHRVHNADAHALVSSKLSDKTLVLEGELAREAAENVAKRKEDVQKSQDEYHRLTRKSRGKIMSAKERKDRRLFDIPPEALKYELYQSLHQLWKEYFAQLSPLQGFLFCFSP